MKCSGISYCRLFVIGYVVLSLGAGASNLHAEADGPDSESGEFTFGAWKVFCEAGLCGSAYQYGRGGSQPTFIRVKLSEEGYPEILVEGGPFTASGSVDFTVDEKLVASGRASLVQAETGDDLRFPPGDDITDGLIGAMKKGRTLQLSVVRNGNKETIEFDLDGFTTALDKL